MPAMNVIPPGLDFSNLKVNLPEDPARKEMELKKPAFNARTTASPRATKDTDDFKDTSSKGAALCLLIACRQIKRHPTHSSRFSYALRKSGSRSLSLGRLKSIESRDGDCLQSQALLTAKRRCFEWTGATTVTLESGR